MKLALNIRIANLTAVVLLSCAIVFIAGFGITIYLAAQEVQSQTDQKVGEALDLVGTYVDGQLQRVEDVSYTMLSSVFGSSYRYEDGRGYISINQATFQKPSEERILEFLNSLLDSNPHICGVAIGFEPFVYPENNGPYGFATYVTNVSGYNQNYKLGDLYDYRNREWYKEAAISEASYWSNPFRESSKGKVVACFSVPLHGFGDRLIGVMAIDIDTEAFHSQCMKVSPFPGAEVSLCDKNFRFITHTNRDYVLQLIADVEQYKNYEADDSMHIKMMNHESGRYVVNKGTKRQAIFYFAPIKRTGWTIAMECPTSEVFSGVIYMRKVTGYIFLVCMIIMLGSFVWVFRKITNIIGQKAGMDKELNIASRIQAGMLPKGYPAFKDRKDLDIYGLQIPAKSIGGDLYDYVIRDGYLYFCIGDVSGKGIPASLVMSIIMALFRNISKNSKDPAYIMSTINSTLCDRNSMNMFCTMFLGILNLETGELEYCNAGHNASVTRRTLPDGKVNVHFMHPKVNIALGVINDFPYEKESTYINRGDAMFLYTDGVSEAENINKELFGEDAILKALADARKHNHLSAKEFVEAVYESVRKHTGDIEQNDDITMMVVEYK